MSSYVLDTEDIPDTWLVTQGHAYAPLGQDIVLCAYWEADNASHGKEGAGCYVELYDRDTLLLSAYWMAPAPSLDRFTQRTSPLDALERLTGERVEVVEEDKEESNNGGRWTRAAVGAGRFVGTIIVMLTVFTIEVIKTFFKSMDELTGKQQQPQRGRRRVPTQRATGAPLELEAGRNGKRMNYKPRQPSQTRERTQLKEPNRSLRRKPST